MTKVEPNMETIITHKHTQRKKSHKNGKINVLSQL